MMNNNILMKKVIKKCHDTIIREEIMIEKKLENNLTFI